MMPRGQFSTLPRLGMVEPFLGRTVKRTVRILAPHHRPQRTNAHPTAYLTPYHAPHSHTQPCQRVYSTASTQTRDKRSGAAKHMKQDRKDLMKSRRIPISPVTRERVVAIDCEMVETKPKICSTPETAADSSVTEDGTLAAEGLLEKEANFVDQKPRQRLDSLVGRCSIVDYNGRTLFDKYIDPRQVFRSVHVITDYRTRYSGITEKHMKKAVPFDRARYDVLNIIRGCILIGHNIENDLKALRISKQNTGFVIRDTGLHKPLKKMAAMNEEHVQTSLRKLTKALLGRDIQSSKGRCGHCSLEDAKATMDLYKLVEKDWEEEGSSPIVGSGEEQLEMKSCD